MRPYSVFVILAGLFLSSGIWACVNSRVDYHLHQQIWWNVYLNSIPMLIDFHADKHPYKNLNNPPDEEHVLEVSMWSGSLGDYYTANLWGWVTVPESGEYVWWLHSDDQSVLYVSKDANWDDLERVAEVTGWGPVPDNPDSDDWLRESLGGGNYSDPIYYEAGEVLFVYGIMCEWYGGDSLGIAWSRDGGTREYLTGPAQDDPINKRQDDFLRDPVLRWTDYYQQDVTYKVYLSTHYDRVSKGSADVLVAEDVTETFFKPGRLAFGVTYYWRVDVVFPAPNNQVFKGKLESFTVEPRSYLIEAVDVEASSECEDKTRAVNLINGSGLEGDRHGSDGDTMWLTAPGNLPATIQFTFDRPVSLDKMKVWNHNSTVERILGFGAKNVKIEYVENGENFRALPGSIVLNRGPGASDYEVNNTIDFGGAMVSAVRMTIHSAYGSFGQVGLSEVQFYAFPAYARYHQPVDGTVLPHLEAALSWRSARQSATAKIVIGKNLASVKEGTSIIDTIDVPIQEDMSYTPRDLDYGSLYFWRIIDINEAANPAEALGPIHYFQTPSGSVIDDFEMYRDEELLEPWAFWLDGYNDPCNGSLVVMDMYYIDEFEQIYEGEQSLPFAYDNYWAPESYVKRAFAPVLDLSGGNEDYIGIYFKGFPDDINDVAHV